MKKAKFKTIFITLAVIMCITAFSACSPSEEDGPKVTPDTGMYLSVTLEKELKAVSFPESESTGKVFEPSFIQYADGNIDGWYTCQGNVTGETWIVYNNFSKDNQKWSDYKCVLQTDAIGFDSYAVSQPSVIKYDDYYYMAYTGTSFNENGNAENSANLFIARSENPDGPFEKWNGNGWGGRGMPFIHYNGPISQPGASCVSLIEIDDTLYIYYTWDSADVNGDKVSQIRLSKADLSKENWPLELNDYGNVCYGKGSVSGLEVKYSESTGKMLALATEHTGTNESRIVCFEGNIPEKLMRVSVVDGEVYNNITSLGLTGSVNGHIRSQSSFLPSLMYEFNVVQEGKKKYIWTEYSTSLSDRTGSSNQQLYKTYEPDESVSEDVAAATSVMALFPDVDFQNFLVGDRWNINFSVIEQSGVIRPLTDKEKERIAFTGHDENIIDFDGMSCISKSTGITDVCAELDGVKTYFTVAVYKDPSSEKENPVYIKCMYDTIRQSMSESSAVQLCVFSESNGGTYSEHFTDLVFSDYDSGIININEKGIIEPVSEGKTEVTITYRDVSCKVTVIITP